jgi:hypothetical protein
LHPWVPCNKKHGGRTTGSTGIIRPSLRNGFNGFLRALPGDRALLPPSPPRSLLLENLTPASGRQDHTTSPYASRRIRLRAACVHRIPRSTSVTIAIRPSARGGTSESIMVILANREAKYFLPKGWTRCLSGTRLICPSGNQFDGYRFRLRSLSFGGRRSLHPSCAPQISAGSADLFLPAFDCHYRMWAPLARQPFRLRDLRARHERHKPVSLFRRCVFRRIDELDAKRTRWLCIPKRRGQIEPHQRLDIILSRAAT